MQEETDEKWSILDLASYHESGPVLKERTPDINRTSFGPGELVYNHADDDEIESGTEEASYLISDDYDEAHISARPPGKSITKKESLTSLHKRALGLMGVPSGSPPGTDPNLSRSVADEENMEASFRTGFGGPSVIDVEEDKPPSNISRKEYSKPINNSNKTESKDYFSFLETGRLKRRRASRVTAAMDTEQRKLSKKEFKMNTEQRELTKLAKALKASGYNRQSNIVIKMATGAEEVRQRAITSQRDEEQEAFESFWETYKVSDHLTAANADAADTFCEGAVGFTTVHGQGLMAAALWVGFTQPEFVTAMADHRAFWRDDYEDTDEPLKVIENETAGLPKIRKALTSIYFRKVTIANFNPDTGRFREAPTPNQGGGTPASGGDGTHQQQQGVQRRQSASTRIWGPVQERLNELEKKGKNGRVLTTEGIWGENTQWAWNAATGALDDNTSRPASVETALATLAATAESVAEASIGPSAEDVTKWLKYDGSLELKARNALVARTRQPPGPAIDRIATLLVGLHLDEAVIAYNEDLATSPDMVMVIGAYDASEEPEADAGGSDSVDLSDYFSHRDSSIHMKKSDGSIYYLDDNKLIPIARRGTAGHANGQDTMTFREGRQMRRVLNDAELSDDQKDAYIGMIVGTRRADSNRRGRRRRGQARMTQSRQTLTQAAESAE